MEAGLGIQVSAGLKYRNFPLQCGVAGFRRFHENAQDKRQSGAEFPQASIRAMHATSRTRSPDPDMTMRFLRPLLVADSSRQRHRWRRTRSNAKSPTSTCTRTSRASARCSGSPGAISAARRWPIFTASRAARISPSCSTTPGTPATSSRSPARKAPRTGQHLRTAGRPHAAQLQGPAEGRRPAGAAGESSTGTCRQLGIISTRQVSSISCTATAKDGRKYELQFVSDGEPVTLRRIRQSSLEEEKARAKKAEQLECRRKAYVAKSAAAGLDRLRYPMPCG